MLLAGGRGTRFWPRSRLRTPKQLLNIVGSETMLRATADRLAPLIAPRNLWVVTNVDQAAAVARELRDVPASHILAEPVGRNTAAAIGLAAMHLAREHGDATDGRAALRQLRRRCRRTTANSFAPRSNSRARPATWSC